MEHTFIKLLILIFLCGVTFGHSQDTTNLPCRLQWTRTVSGVARPLDSLAVGGGGGNKLELVARIFTDTNFDLEMFVGRLHPESDVALTALVNDNGTVQANYEFDILSNPHGCTLEWSARKQDQFVVPTESGLRNYVGRAIYEDGWVAGQIVNENEFETGVEVEQEPLRTEEFQYLLSYSRGLQMLMTKFTFEPKPTPASPSFFGVEQIINRSPVDASQTLSHKRVIRETSMVAITETTASKYTSTVSWEIGFGWFGQGGSQTETHEYIKHTTTNITTVTEVTVEVSREVIVPPYTSIRACSLISLTANTLLDYTAKGIYTAPSLNSIEILNYLKEENIEAEEDEEGNVFVEVRGKVRASMALDTEFVIDQIVEGDEGNACSSIENYLRFRGRKLEEIPIEYRLN